MVERDEDSRNGKRTNVTDRKQQSPPTFVNHFAKYIESKVSYAEALRLGHVNQETHSPNDSATNTAVDGNLSRSYSTPFFDSSVPSKPSLPHSISSPDLESQDSKTENNSSLAARDYPNSSSSSVAIAKRSYSDPSAFSKSNSPLYFGKLKSCLSLPKSFPDRYASTDLKTSSNGKPPTPSPSRLSNSDFLREELQHLIKRTMESGKSPPTTYLIFTFRLLLNI
ncbi:hypothetical protein HS088_TW18G00165 [Tripterygium wilfordii]|uniref:Uncharacterized protein n=1 Tax=Tripterygium wilfordii TaxID=458696 RepID=A0A7J7CC88_TRIWF|nr:hypothetical protein HS088_TW18G00165 [Tripterygium wilfordii]